MLGLTGCMGTADGAGPVAMFASLRPGAVAGPETSEARAAETASSEIISDLQARRSVLPAGSAYDRVAAAVMAASGRAAVAELRASRLRAEAEAKNWLPSIGPSLSLSSMGDFVAQLVVEQVLFDNGRKTAERAFAKADVEVAAVTLSQDMNDRVAEALTLYLTAAEARDRARLSREALGEMEHFEYIMSERVRGGVSDMSDLTVIRQKLGELRATRAAAQETEAAALASLDAMSAAPLGEVRGLSEVDIRLGPEPLTVLKARAEMQRDIEAAKIERAGHLPGLKAGGSLGEGGSGIGLQVSSDKLFGLGTGASLKAIEATEDAARARVEEVREDSAQDLARLEREDAALMRRPAKRRTWPARRAIRSSCSSASTRPVSDRSWMSWAPTKPTSPRNRACLT